MAFALFILVNSCKKESDNNEKIDPERKKEMLAYKNGPKVETIPFAQFIQKANLNALGTLKQEFVAASPLKSKTMSIQTDETYFGFKIITDSIKVIKDKGHTMYVFPVSLPSKRAISFQNLTIDESAERTLVFVNTYTPTKKWIADWKEGHAGKFDGEISVTYLNLNNGSTSNSTGTANKKNNQNTISVEQTCTTTTYYFQTPYLCASGNHYPGQDCYLLGDERAGYTYSEYDITTCENENPGGGGTTTNPPPDYDPCPTDPPTVPEVNNKKSLRNKIMVVPPSECDEDRLPEDTDAIRAFEVDYKSQMAASELVIYNNMSRSNQLSYLINAQTAMDMAVTRFPNMSQTDSKADAFRHAYFSLLNVKSLGLTLATNLGNAHETKNNQSALAKSMDLFNNDVGRNAFIDYPVEAPYWSIYADIAYGLITNGNLRYINNGQLTPTNQ